MRITKKQLDNIRNVRYFFDYEIDEDYNKRYEEFEDDGFIHIIIGKHCFSFYNGQDEDCLTEENISYFKNIVYDILKLNKKEKKQR